MTTEREELDLLAPDGQRLFACEWRAVTETPRRGVVCIVHGMGEHSGRFGHVAAAFAAAGYAVLAHDQRGHGRTAGKRGHTPSYEALLDDVGLLLHLAEQRYPGLPRFLYGHSMGGNVVLGFTLRKQPPLAGVIATSPWLTLAFAPPSAKVRLARFMNRLWPSYSEAAGLNAADLFRPAEEATAVYRGDPYVHDAISVRFFTAIHAAGLWSLAHADRLAVPLLLMHGTADRITSFEASRQFAETTPQELCTFRAWEDGYHELHNEPFRQEVIESMIAWTNERLERTTSH